MRRAAPPAEGRLGGRLRLRDRVHGHRPRRPDPAGARRGRSTPRPSQVELLFTSYFAITGVAMLVTGLVSSRIGAKRDAARRARARRRLQRARRRVGLDRRDRRLPRRLGPRQRALHRHRAGGDRRRGERRRRAARSSCTRPRSASASPSGPLLGGLLGGISWRGPFFGTAALMAIGFVAIARRCSRRRPKPARTVVARRAAARRCATAACSASALDRALLQLRLLHAARLHAVPAAHGRARARLRVLRLGPAAGDPSVFVAPRLQAPVRRCVPTLVARCSRWSPPILAVMGVVRGLADAC